ncbi:MAG: SIMPL domain-containing protein [Methanophagales archaeon]|nr:SIMPL domain-containing protein [Methanophagales archaeon]
MNKKIGFAAGLLLAVIVLVALALVFSPSLSEEQAFNRTIEVSGSGIVKTTPDEAHVMIAVVSEALTAQDAAAMNSENMTNVFAALKKAGISDVKTRQYSITPIYEWVEEVTLEGKKQKSVIVGYRATNLIEVVSKPEDAGKAIDAAVSGGANRIDSISFQLSEALQEKAYSDALRKAVNNAQSKADVVAGEMGIVSIYPVKISVEDFYLPVYRITAPMEAAPMPAPTPITPSEVEVSASVRIVYAF